MVIKRYWSLLGFCEARGAARDFHNSFYPTGYLMRYSAPLVPQCISGKDITELDVITSLRRLRPRNFTIMIIFMWTFPSLSSLSLGFWLCQQKIVVKLSEQKNNVLLFGSVDGRNSIESNVNSEQHVVDVGRGLQLKLSAGFSSLAPESRRSQLSEMIIYF